MTYYSLFSLPPGGRTRGCAIFLGTLFARKFYSRISILKEILMQGNILLGNRPNFVVEHVMKSQNQPSCFKSGKVYISHGKMASQRVDIGQKS